MNLKSIITAMVSSFAAIAAHSQSFSNAPNGILEPFGSPDTTTFGETFSLGSASTLLDWSFFALTSQSTGSNLAFGVAAWDGSKAVGPALYSALGSYSASDGDKTLSFTGINTSLDAGTYIAYLTTAGVTDPVGGVNISGSDTDGGLGGGFTFLNSNGQDPLSVSSPGWFPVGAFPVPNMQYSADFGAVAPVPEPSTYALMLAGLGVVGFVAGRRKGRPTI